MTTRALLLAMIVLLPLAAVPADATSNVHERNAAFLWSLLGDGAAPDAIATLHDGRVLSLAAAVDDAAARAGSVDLAALASGAAPTPALAYFGDMWVLELGVGECVATMIADLPLPANQANPQLEWYEGATGTLSTAHGYYTEIISWSMKDSYLGVNTAGFTALGNTDAYCFHFGGTHLAFPFVDGIVTMN